VGSATHFRPVRPSTWLFGEAGGIQVWAATGKPSVRASVLIGEGAPVILINYQLVGTPAEYGAIAWAFARIAEGARGYIFWCD
jgi:hypothetical protein